MHLPIIFAGILDLINVCFKQSTRQGDQLTSLSSQNYKENLKRLTENLFVQACVCLKTYWAVFHHLVSYFHSQSKVIIVTVLMKSREHSSNSVNLLKPYRILARSQEFLFKTVFSVLHPSVRFTHDFLRGHRNISWVCVNRSPAH